MNVHPEIADYTGNVMNGVFYVTKHPKNVVIDLLYGWRTSNELRRHKDDVRQPGTKNIALYMSSLRV